MGQLEDYSLDFSNPYSYVERIKRGIYSLPPLIISVGITGGNQGKEANPNLPESPEEQAEQTAEAYKAGASLVHIHRRKRENPAEMSSSPEDYKEVNAMIREKCPDIIINNTAGGSPTMSIEERFSSVQAMPEVASLDLTSIPVRMLLKARKAPLTGRPEDITVDTIFSITFGESEWAAKLLRENSAKPELEIFDTGDFTYIHNLIRKKLLDPPYWIQLVMGAVGANFPTPSYLLSMLQYVPQNSLVSIIGVGTAHIPMITMGILLGCHVRVGMEDNIFIEKGKLAESNAQLVEKVVRLAKELGREIATPKEARKMLGLSEIPRQYR